VVSLLAIISWGRILYGAALSAALAALVVIVALRERRIAAVVGAVVATAAAPVGWNSILRATHASNFFTDAPIAVFPASWQDFGSGVFTLAAVCLVLAVWSLRREAAARVALLAGACALAAFLVDIYLY
jgi:hypothetical protein